MRVVTIVSLAASAVLGLGALFVAKTFLPNDAQAKGQAQQVAGVSVVVAARDIKYGDKLEAGMLAVVRTPENLTPQGAFTSVAQVLASDKGGPPVALVPIAAREPLLPAKLSGPGARPSVAASVAEGMRAFTLKVNDVSGVGGHALPGDRVDVVLTRDLTPEGDVRNFVSQVVVQNVRVLGVNLNADQQANKPAEPDNATIEVTVEEAQKLAIAAELGKLSLALRRTGQADLAEATLIRTGDFALGGAPRGAARAAVGPPRASSAPGPARISVGILIIEGAPAKRNRVKKSSPDGPTTVPAPADAPQSAGAPSASNG
jgi:pilus assembly protein CpaB